MWSRSSVTRSRPAVDDDRAQHQRNLRDEIDRREQRKLDAPASVSAIAVATAMFRVANSVASVNTSGGGAPITVALNQPARNDAVTKVAAQMHRVTSASAS
jgi:hypothetical protein